MDDVLRATERLMTMAVEWAPNPVKPYHYFADVEGRRFVIRINDFPNDEMYSLILNDHILKEFSDRPAGWSLLATGGLWT